MTGQSVGRIPRKSSLASLKAAVMRQTESPSASQSPKAQVKDLAASNDATAAPYHSSSIMSPASLASAAAYEAALPDLPPSASSYGETHDQPSDTPPLLVSGERSYTSSSAATQGSPSSLFPPVRSGSQIPTSSSLPAFSLNAADGERHLDDSDDGQFVALQKTPEMGSSGPRFQGFGGNGQTISAPVTPAYAEPSVISTSGRLGKPLRPNAVKNNFRLSEWWNEKG